MLVVRRGVSERVIIGDGANQITVMVVRIKDGQVSLGIDAPKDVPILRDDAVHTLPKEVGR